MFSDKLLGKSDSVVFLLSILRMILYYKNIKIKVLLVKKTQSEHKYAFRI